jgi:hypothetical protein
VPAGRHAPLTLVLMWRFERYIDASPERARRQYTLRPWPCRLVATSSYGLPCVRAAPNSPRTWHAPATGAMPTRHSTLSSPSSTRACFALHRRRFSNSLTGTTKRPASVCSARLRLNALRRRGGAVCCTHGEPQGGREGGNGGAGARDHHPSLSNGTMRGSDSCQRAPSF